MKRILVVMGTRPEAIKLCPLVMELRKNPLFSVSVLSSGQHGEMLADAMHAFSIAADFELNAMRRGQSASRLYARILAGCDVIFRRESPDVVLVQGDTTTALAAAQAAFYQRIAVGHVEAGLRTYHIHSPFPEEMHRRAIALMSEYHFAPTATSAKNLLGEGIEERRIFVTGNTVIDALRYTLGQEQELAMPQIPQDGRLLIFTAHRREHHGRTLEGMLSALCRIVEAHADVVAVCPLHPNPTVRETTLRRLASKERILCIDPPSVTVFHRLLSRAYLILTDSGGIQEEACALGIPTVVMRYSTERTEGVLAGNLRLAGSGEEGIVEAAKLLLCEESSLYQSMRRPSAVYGDGGASARISEILQKN